jgi:HSP20 family protein
LKEETEKRSYSERFFGSFERSITIPAGIDESAIQATLKDGVLEVRVPKMEVVKPEARKVEIKQP